MPLCAAVVWQLDLERYFLNLPYHPPHCARGKIKLGSHPALFVTVPVFKNFLFIALAANLDKFKRVVIFLPPFSYFQRATHTSVQWLDLFEVCMGNWPLSALSYLYLNGTESHKQGWELIVSFIFHRCHDTFQLMMFKNYVVGIVRINKYQWIWKKY